MKKLSKKGSQKSSKSDPKRPLGRQGSIYSSILSIWAPVEKNMFFRSAKKRPKIIKNRPKCAQGPILSFCRIAEGAIFGQEVPGAASRARTSKQKNDRGAVGGGSDTPWAVGPANLCPKAQCDPSQIRIISHFL